MNVLLTITADYWYFFLGAIIYYLIIIPYWTGYMRMRLIDLRSDWLSFATQGGIKLSDELYMSVRSMTTLAMYNCIGLGEYLILFVLKFKSVKQSEINLKNYNELQIDESHKVMRNIGRITFYMLLIRSPLLTLLSMPVIMIVLFKRSVFFADIYSQCNKVLLNKVVAP